MAGRRVVTYQSVWGNNPPTTQQAPGGQVLLRQTFYTDVDCTLFGVRFYRDRADPGNHIAVLIKRGSPGNRDGQRAAAFVRNPALVGQFGWNNKYLGQPLDLAANEWWDLVMWYTNGLYYDTPAALAGAPIVSGNIHLPQDGAVDPFGVVTPNGAFNNGVVTFNPNITLGGSHLGIDVLVLPK
jgi:hypothetical protein